MEPWRDLFARIFVGDILDIALVAAISYALLGAVGSVRGRAMFSIVAALVALDFVAMRLGMSLTVGMLRAGLLVFLVAVAVAFRDDVRAAVQRLTTWKLFGKPSNTSVTAHEVVVETMERLTARSIGALLVVPGRESPEPYMSGGIELDGLLSSALLESLFDPNSVGHDGAVLLEGERIRRFGVHLPLSRATDHLRHMGTRHAAALGLSERCDALVIAVSEERGTISVAKRGRIDGPMSGTELAVQLADHTAPTPRNPGLSRFSFGRAAAALAIAVTLWFGFVFQKGTAEQKVELPVEYTNLPENHMVVDPKPSTVSLSVAGRRAAFAALDTSQTLRVDLSGAKSGSHVMVLDENSVHLPPSLEVLRFNPSAIHLRIAETEIVTRRVQVITRGSLPADLSIESHPPLVRVHAPVASADRPIYTAPVDLDGVTKPTTLSTKLVLPPGMRLAEGEDLTVAVQVKPTGA